MAGRDIVCLRLQLVFSCLYYWNILEFIVKANLQGLVRSCNGLLFKEKGCLSLDLEYYEFFTISPQQRNTN